MGDRSDEKERLYNEVLGRKRAYEKDNAQEVKLTIDPSKKSSSYTDSILKSADQAMDRLNEILLKQKKELEDMKREVDEMPSSDIKGDAIPDLDQLENELKQDYGVETKQETVKEFDHSQVFREIEEDLNAKIIGQSEAVRKICIAFRRPFVMGQNENGVQNVILVHGPHGSGKHACISEIAKELKNRNIFESDTVCNIDCSRYTSASQEQIFLQDMYEALNDSSSVICFENFESCFPSFLRMIDSLVKDGKIVLNKRYVLKQGILVENQTGLVKDSVDSLQANGKYLVFITSGKVSAVQDAFGADFMYHVLDQVTFQSLDDEAVSKIIMNESDAFVSKCLQQLHIKISFPEQVRSWIHTHFDKTRGVDSIRSIFYDFYVSVSEAVLQNDLGSNESVELIVDEDVPYASIKGSKIRLSREKNSAAEIEEVNKELDEIVGLNEVKKYIRSLQANVAMQKKRKEQGMKTASVSMHMIFTGNPGTGKTTIARLLARYMKAIGVLSQGQLVEVTRGDLVAQYVGQTAPLTMSVIRSAMGGVLFIDEAYSLYRGKDDSFGLEAIDTLVKAMEDNRDNLIVVLAGYKKEMAVFLESNSGLKSRFPNLINYPDYTGEELRKIACIQAKSKGYEIEETSYEKLEAYFNEVQSINPQEAGNGRLARNLVEEAILNQSGRVVNETDASSMSLLKLEDFDLTIKVKPEEKKDDTSLQDLMDLVNKSK